MGEEVRGGTAGAKLGESRGEVTFVLECADAWVTLIGQIASKVEQIKCDTPPQRHAACHLTRI